MTIPGIRHCSDEPNGDFGSCPFFDDQRESKRIQTCCATRKRGTMQRRPLILLALCLAAFVISVDVTIVNVVLPTLVASLGASTTQPQWIVDAYSLVFAALVLAAGSLGDRLGRKGTSSSAWACSVQRASREQVRARRWSIHRRPGRYGHSAPPLSSRRLSR